MRYVIFIFLFCSVFTAFTQNANWGTGVPITVTVNGSTLDLSVFDPIINQTKTTNFSVGNNPVYQNVDGIVVGTGSYGTMYYATYDLELHTWKTSNSSIGSSNMVVKTSDGVVVGTGSYGTMYYATYDVELHTWKSSNSSIGSSNMDVKTFDGIVVGTGSYGTMYYATYDVELHTWKTSNSSIGSSNMDVKTSDGVVVGTGSYGTMYYATYDVELHTWKTSNSSIGSSNMDINTSDGVVVGKGSYGTMYFAIYDFNLDSWKSDNVSIGSNGGFTLSGGTISYYGTSSGTKGYNASSHSWGSSPTTSACNLLTVTTPGSNWVFMRCMSIGANTYTYSCGDGHQISRKQGWKKYNISNQYNVDLNVSNGVGNSNCNKTINISTTGIDETINYSFQIIPNPAIDRVYINSTEIKNAKIDMYNKTGESVLQRELSSGTNEIDISFLETGIYIIRLTGADGTIQKKLIKY